MDFASKELYDVPHLVVNGYFPSLSIKHVLNTITEQLLEDESTFRSVNEHADYIAAVYRAGNGVAALGLYLIIHNIDGTMLRGDAAQMALSTLAGTRRIHVVASIDHINAPLLWDHDKLARFNW